MLKRLSISQKVFGGFGVILVLLVVIGVVGSMNLDIGSKSFDQYRSIARQTTQAGRVQANLLEARLAAKNFMINASDEGIRIVDQRLKHATELNETLAELVADDPQQLEVVEKARDDLIEYQTVFKEVARLHEEQINLVHEKLEVFGSAIEDKLKGIMQSARSDDDADIAFQAGVAVRNALTMRLHAGKFLRNNKKAAYEMFRKESELLQRDFDILLGMLKDQHRLQLAQAVPALKKNYIAAMTEAFQTISRRNNLVDTVLDVIGPEIAAHLEELKLDIKNEQDRLGSQATASMKTAMSVTMMAALASILFGILAAWLIGTGISRPIKMITDAMKSLADGDKTTEIPGQERRDEIGAMSKAVLVFKENMIRNDELAEEEALQAKLREERASRIESITQTFDASVSELLGALSSASTEMENSAHSMSGIAQDTNKRALTVTTAAEQASNNVQTVASATEELTSSIQEIARLVDQSSQIASNAVSQAGDTDQKIQGLSLSAQKIGDVVSLISDIAEQTNLLALNATIEAARAGDAGKGFAVVAAEVKELANQTAKATDEIGQQINSIQVETDNAVKAIQLIGGTIDEMNEIATNVASAVEEQTNATGEIAKNVEEAATGTREVSENIQQVQKASSETGDVASSVNSTAGDLGRKSNQLRKQVEDFLSEVRAA